MRSFCHRADVFIFLNLLIAFLLLYAADARFQYQAGTSEAMLPAMGQNRRFSFIIMGASHARVFSASGNGQRVSKIVNAPWLNFSKTAAGLIPEKIYLAQFYQAGNTADQIIYFLDPFVFYAPEWNEQALFLEDEPLRPSMFVTAWQEGASSETLVNYVRSKFTPYWLLLRQPASSAEDRHTLKERDTEAVRKRLAVLYPQGASGQMFSRYQQVFESSIALVASRGAKISIIMPPTLLGTAPGHDAAIALLKELKKRYTITYYDFSSAIQDPRLFTDHDHLNSAGVEFFTENALKPLLGGQQPLLSPHAMQVPKK